VAFSQNSNSNVPGIPARDELRPMLNKDSLPSSSLACGLPSPAFIGDDSRIELSYLINLFVGDQPNIQREMEGSDEGEVSLKELKDTVPLQAKQMVELKAAMSQREEITSRSSEYPLGSLPGSEAKSGAGREPVVGITPFRPFREARQQLTLREMRGRESRRAKQVATQVRGRRLWMTPTPRKLTPLHQRSGLKWYSPSQGISTL